MKEITVHILEVLLSGLVLIFCLNFILNVTSGGRTGLFQIVGSLPATAISDSQTSGSRETLLNIQSTPEPEITYTGGTCTAGEKLQLKGMFTVYLPDKNMSYNGREENGFRIEIEDVLDEGGKSYGAEMDAGLMEDSEEVLSALSYDAQTGEICFYQSGIFRIFLRIYGSNGRQARKVISIPVEVGG